MQLHRWGMTRGSVRHARHIAMLVLLLVHCPVPAANGTVNTDAAGVAIHGYDPVAYFVDGMPRRGRADLGYDWSGSTWLFAVERNREAFIENPGRYAPQFGGFCAYAASYGQFADIDPHAWSIVDGRLYLNFSLRVRQTWRPRAQEFIGDARQLWPTMVRDKTH